MLMHKTTSPTAAPCFLRLFLIFWFTAQSDFHDGGIYTKLAEILSPSSTDDEKESFSDSETTEFLLSQKPRRSAWLRLQTPALYLSNLMLLQVVFILSLQNFQLSQDKSRDPSSTVVSPANGVMEYQEKIFKGGFSTTGTLDLDNNFFRHFTYYIDAIYQPIIYYTDVSPISFYISLLLSVEEARRVAEESGFDYSSVEDDPI
ncbi:hypothetical protein B0H63DRAFT_519128 [Podospora didyma]|uniref:Uncharacterized protein n=1 Tax=Podospora didyma TaxID=330526 RepID=A0AAE0NY79_9PEZI|nr:hypothetical protein B0H63DRAFT_519128 [Podospora didyma]